MAEPGAAGPLAWARTGEGPVPRAVRAARRLAARADARLRHGSVPRFMDAVAASTPEAPRPARSSSGARNSGRPRVVELSTYPLHPRQSGGQLRGWYLAEALAHDHGADVSVISLTTHAAAAGHRRLADGLAETCLLLPDDHAKREAKLRLVSGAAAITDVASGLMWTGIDGLVDALRRELEGATSIVLVQPYLVRAALALGDGIPIVCDEHNDELTLKRSIYPASPGGAWLLDRVDDIERAAVSHAALVTATTRTDLEALDDRYRLQAPTDLVPNGVDTTAIEFVTGADRSERGRALATRLGLEPGRSTALFVGSGHLPNIEAGEQIAEIARRVPEVDFLLAGRHSERMRHAHVASNVHLLGKVSDELLDLLLGGCDVALNPMSAGSGSNLKLLTYLAAGLPVVSTDVGARGIDAEAAGLVIVGRADLEGGIRRLVDADPSGRDEASERALAGRRYVEDHCDWRAIGRRFATICAEHTT